MAKKKTSVKKDQKSISTISKVKSFVENRQNKTIFGAFLILFSIFMTVAFVSFFYTWQQDQSALNQFSDRSIPTGNLLGKIGAKLSNVLVFKGFGLGTFILNIVLFFTGARILLQSNLKKIITSWNWGLLGMLWASISLGFVNTKYAILSGIIGFELNEYLQTFIGKTGLIILLLFFFISYLIIRFSIDPDAIVENLEAKKKEKEQERINNEEDLQTSDTPTITPESKNINIENDSKSDFELSVENLTPTIKNHSEVVQKDDEQNNDSTEVNLDTTSSQNEPELKVSEDTIKEVEVAIEKIAEEKSVTENLSDKLLKDFGEFDPKLELSNYRFPTFNLLKEYNESISVDPTELEANKNQIVETLKNYKIGIAQIKATVGPTITLYEIVPEAGVRISKIKNLEDDIALSLAALGIRIIAPIPGKGTIGIEVPNKKATIVSMHSVISSKKFQESPMELPIAMGKTISNETFVTDLAKMPHLLMAGATGQGKSVGLNTILTSLLYKKHPAEVKFVLVDPKKVELTLFNKIERHYLAKLPDDGEAIITDTTKVVNTLNSLCIEMDARYDLLKDAMVRNIKEYNAKFKARKLNPENGHQFLPYIVLVIDEFADLIMTAGKEVETPIARLAQLARAIGIHLIVATQRPSVNVITGIIKANFPSRIAFRVTSKIDSRTILDAPGADQLIGRGDMLYSGGNDLTRIQCAFVDTPEVEKITDFIGSQRAYAEAHLLPEYVGEEGGTNVDIDIANRDKLFKEAAEVIVTAQQGSASLLQRKLKLGYNRAGRLIDQLEAAGIVGPFEGSKARQVLVPDFIALEQLLDNEKNN
ncbi:DNA segregation ATPase FtsK/SpoIIIE, S-DNA-T family [Tenacibaculum sp. MAR_2009_124]|uniref:FtsK/SpoIIIE family DNA translocase n=1 Tax=Tenacibaculum sp. MAR_2009_124 TaxID=1250059 RepID=UPI000898CE20|nr:DNA translocase FtsK [Tenacibaculum sp. MAR_2009_124]SEB40721.1 DNA segregation ATPase FtsK/SpoIIIE, S-DNA-T family [Tenacibaculum sp. MAR_2009_124]